MQQKSCFPVLSLITECKFHDIKEVNDEIPTYLQGGISFSHTIDGRCP